MGAAIVSNSAASALSLVATDRNRAKEAAALFRATALELSPDTLDSDQDNESDLLGIVIDAGLAHDTLSLTVLADGSVALQSFDVSVCADQIHDTNLRGKCADLLQYAMGFLAISAPSTDLGKPSQGEVCFYLLTNRGPRIAQSSIEALSRIDEPLGVLYFAAQRVVSVLEQMFAALENVAQGDSRLDDTGWRKICSVHEIDGDSQCSSVGNAAPRWRT